MLHLNFKDLTYLRRVLLDSNDDRSPYILTQVDQDLARIPKAVIPIATRSRNGDIYFKTDREIEDFLFQASSGSPNNQFLVIAENTVQAEFLFSRLVYLLKLRSYQKQERRLVFENGSAITILTRPQADRGVQGMVVDAVIIQTNQQNPIH